MAFSLIAFSVFGLLISSCSKVQKTGYQTAKEKSKDDKVIVELTGEDGEIHKVEILDAIDYKGKRYAVLNRLNEKGESLDEKEIVIMLIVMKDAQPIFRTIKDDREFNEIVDHVKKSGY